MIKSCLYRFLNPLIPVGLILSVLVFFFDYILPAFSISQDTHYPQDFPNEADYISFLQKFPIYAENQWNGDYMGDPQIGYFGRGSHDHNEIRSISNFIFIYALLAVDKNYDGSISGVSQDILLDHARAALRYFTRTHVTGDMECADGRKWGKQPEQWLSPWVTSKAVSGAKLIWDKLTQTEKDAIQQVVVYEADNQVKKMAGSRAYKDTNAEISALNAEILAWAFNLYPTHFNAGRWLYKAQEFFMNTFSVWSDRYDMTLVDGRPVSSWVYTTNVHSDFTIEGHGAYQFDYIACALQSIAWSYYAFVSNGNPVPEALFHHVLDVWNTVKKTNLYNGCFAYMQGQDWARYVYGYYFIMPALVLLENEFVDHDARLIERLRFIAFQFEQDYDNDGSIFGQRFAYQTIGWPARYETDCYANIGLAYLLHRFAPLIQAESMEIFQKKMEGNFQSKYCDFMYSRSKDTFISFSWKHFSGPYPMALFVPGDDYMVEWEARNLIGHINVKDFDMSMLFSIHKENFLELGFTTTGYIQEGKLNGLYGVGRYISFTAIPEDKLAVIIEYLVANEDITVTDQAGLCYYLPNDIFNDYKRNIYSENDEPLLLDFFWRSTNIEVKSKWINVDNKLGIVGVLDNGKFMIMSRKGRNIWKGLLYEQIRYSNILGSQINPYSYRHYKYKKGDIIQEHCYLVIGGDSDLTRNVAVNGAQWLETGDNLIKAVKCKINGFNGLIISNFHQETMTITTQLRSGKYSLIELPALNTVVLKDFEAEEVSAIQSGILQFDQGTSIQPLHIKPDTWGKIKNTQLFQNYPNPCNPGTWIPFQLGDDNIVSISIFDVKGSHIRTLNLGPKRAGSYLSKKQTAYWDGKNEAGEKVPSGIYFYTIQAGDFTATKRMVVER